MLLLIIPNIFNKINLKKILSRAMRGSATSIDNIYNIMYYAIVCDVIYLLHRNKKLL